MPINPREPIMNLCDMYPQFTVDLPPVSFRYPPDLLLARSDPSSQPAASSADVSSWNIPLVRSRLFALDIPSSHG